MFKKILFFTLLFLLLSCSFKNVFAADPASDPDVNIRPNNVDPSRGINWLPGIPTLGGKGLIDVGGPTDPAAPQLSGLIGNTINTSPNITGIYQVRDRNKVPVPPNNSTNWGVTAIDLAAGSGEEIKVPVSGYDIGGGYQAVILYASDSDITINNTNGSKGVASGYTIHLFDINVDPKLLAMYKEGQAQGKLVALPCKATLGTVRGGFVKLVIRDTGNYMDPRTRKDWWHEPLSSDCKGNPTLIIPDTSADSEVPCNETRDNEFHNLRPYPHNPCNKRIEEVTLSCGNDLYVAKNFTIKPNGNDLEDLPSGCAPISSCGPGQKCTFQCSGIEAKISVDLSKAELPIAGNTELVPNQESKDNNLDLLQRMNEYVSWYLNGTMNMPFEDDFSKLATVNSTPPYIFKYTEEAVNRLVNLSGPLNKLLPWRVKNGERIQQVDDAQASKNGAEIRHDQIAVCSLAGIPIPCTNDVSLLTKIFTLGGLKANRFTAWTDHKPPWEEDPKFKYVTDYWKTFIEWEGGHCSPSVSVLGHQFYVCDTTFTGGQNFFSEFIAYLLPSSTEDRKGQVKLQVPEGDQKVGESKASNVVFTPDSDSHTLYFAHMQEDAELGKLLQGTFASQGQDGFATVNSDGRDFPTGPHCEIVDANVRKNPGDRLYGDYNNPKAPNDKQISGKLKYDITFTCNMSTVPDGCFDTCAGGDPSKTTECQRKCSPQCSQNTYAGISVFTKTPKAQEIWERLVNGPASVFKRFFPLVGSDAPLTEIKDLPTVANASYDAVPTSTLYKGLEAVAGDPSGNKPGSDAQLVIPYLGGVQEYFLKGIQKALRPKGFENTELAGTNHASYNPALNEEPGTDETQCIKLNQSIPTDIPFRDTSVKPKSKEEIYELIKKRFPTTQLLTYYDEVVQRAIASGYNPAFVLTIWIEETGASDTTQFGLVHDLGCGGGHGIEEQLDCFTNLYKDWSVGGQYYSTVKECISNGQNPNFEDFMLLFAEGCQGALKNNRMFCFHKYFPGRIQTFYNLVKASPSIIQF